MFTNEQLQIIEAEPAHTVVYAAPGSGKTTVLTQHIIYQLRKSRCIPKGIMAMTFTRQSALEMKRRIWQSGGLSTRATEALKIGTFHSQLFKLLLKLNPNIPVLLSSSEQYEMMKICYERILGRHSGGVREKVQHFLTLCSNQTAQYPPRRLPRKEAKIVDAYTKLKTQTHRWDFDDILQGFCQELELNSVQLLRSLNGIQYILVDEFQDTNAVQWTIIQSLISNLKVPVFVVGDDDQSIYGFRGASPEFLISFADVYKSAHKYTLTANFRSVAQIIHHATNLIKWNHFRTQKVMKSARRERGNACAFTVESEERESELVLHLLKEVKIQHPEWTCAILARTRRQLYFVWTKLADVDESDVQLRTFHDAKGKEWDVVFIVGLFNENPYLAKLPMTDDEIEEERRLYYVALTRAKNTSYTFVPKRAGKTAMKPSKFVEEAVLPCMTI